MRAYKILSAIIVAAMLLAVPMVIAADASEAAVDEKTSAVYFQSKEGVSPEEIGKFINIDMSASFIQTVLEATGDFNFGSDGFTITEIKTSDYCVETGISSHICGNDYRTDAFRTLQLQIEIKMTANSDGSSLFSDGFNGDAAYGFEKYVSVKQNDTMTFKGTLRTEYSKITDYHSQSNDGKYVLNDRKYDLAERTQLELDAVYRSSNGMQQSFKFTNSFEGYSSHSAVLDGGTYSIDSLALGDICTEDSTDSVSGKGHVTMEYEGKTFSADSPMTPFLTVYSGIWGAEDYSGKQTCTVDNTILKTENEYKSMYCVSEPKDLFDNFKGTNQELFEKIGTVGSATIDDFDKVDNSASNIISDIEGNDQKDTSGQIITAVIAVLVAVVLVLIVALIIAKRKKNRW